MPDDAHRRLTRECSRQAGGMSRIRMCGDEAGPLPPLIVPVWS